MRNQLKKDAFVPDRIITDELWSYGAAARDLGMKSGTSTTLVEM